MSDYNNRPKKVIVDKSPLKKSESAKRDARL